MKWKDLIFHYFGLERSMKRPLKPRARIRQQSSVTQDQIVDEDVHRLAPTNDVSTMFIPDFSFPTYDKAAVNPLECPATLPPRRRSTRRSTLHNGTLDVSIGSAVDIFSSTFSNPDDVPEEVKAPIEAEEELRTYRVTSRQPPACHSPEVIVETEEMFPDQPVLVIDLSRKALRPTAAAVNCLDGGDSSVVYQRELAGISMRLLLPPVEGHLHHELRHCIEDDVDAYTCPYTEDSSAVVVEFCEYASEVHVNGCLVDARIFVEESLSIVAASSLSDALRTNGSLSRTTRFLYDRCIVPEHGNIKLVRIQVNGVPLAVDGHDDPSKDDGSFMTHPSATRAVLCFNPLIFSCSSLSRSLVDRSQGREVLSALLSAFHDDFVDLLGNALCADLRVKFIHPRCSSARELADGELPLRLDVLVRTGTSHKVPMVRHLSSKLRDAEGGARRNFSRAYQYYSQYVDVVVVTDSHPLDLQMTSVNGCPLR